MADKDLPLGPWNDPDREWVCEVHGLPPLGECPFPGCIGPWMLATDWVEPEG